MNPCRKCGANDRYDNGNCKPCSRARNAAYVALHKEQILDYQAEYRVENASKLKAYYAEYHATKRVNREASCN